MYKIKIKSLTVLKKTVSFNKISVSSTNEDSSQFASKSISCFRKTYTNLCTKHDDSYMTLQTSIYK